MTLAHTMPATLNIPILDQVPLREWDGYVPPDAEAALVQCDEADEPYVLIFKEAA